MPGDPQQLLQRRREVARRGLPPRQALRVRGQRRAAQLRALAQPRPAPLDHPRTPFLATLRRTTLARLANDTVSGLLCKTS